MHKEKEQLSPRDLQQLQCFSSTVPHAQYGAVRTGQLPIEPLAYQQCLSTCWPVITKVGLKRFLSQLKKTGFQPRGRRFHGAPQAMVTSTPAIAVVVARLLPRGACTRQPSWDRRGDATTQVICQGSKLKPVDKTDERPLVLYETVRCKSALLATVSRCWPVVTPPRG